MSSRPQQFFRYFFLSVLAVCLGGATLIAGLGAGRTVIGRFFPKIASVSQQTFPNNPSFGPEPFVFPIRYYDVDFTEAIEKIRSAVVSITVSSARFATGSGSGFIFYADDTYAYVATNNHVIENAAYISISLDDETNIPARAIGENRENDLAVLAVLLTDLEENGVPFSVAVLGDSSVLRRGDSVVAIGNALGAGQRTTQGIVSALDLTISVPNLSTGVSLTLNVFQTDAAVNRGNSGGPLINERGEVVGIITAKFMGEGAEGMGYVLPINNIRDLMETLREEGSIVIPFMGIRHGHINEELRELYNLPKTGQLITGVSPNTPAHEAGLRRGDLIVYFGGVRLYTFEIFLEALMSHAVGDTVILGFYRDEIFMETEITLGAPR
jgi:S1-C subfamily serine protease